MDRVRKTSLRQSRLSPMKMGEGFTQHHFCVGMRARAEKQMVLAKSTRRIRAVMMVRKSGAGFTLLEGVIAVGIISVGLIVGLALAYSNLTAAQANSDRIIAANLAREGIEIVRNIRDSNWMRRDANIDKDGVAAGQQFYAWDDFFDGWPTPVSGVPANCTTGECGNYFDAVLDPTLPATAYNYKLVRATTNAIPCSVTGSPQFSCRIRRSGSLYYQATASSDPATIFYRRIILKPICFSGTTEAVIFDGDAPSMLCPLGQTKIGILADAQVVWRRGNKTLEIDAKERLYNWRN